MADDKAQASDWYSPDWEYRKVITVDNTLNESELTDYQILVTLNADNFDYLKANGDGSDLRFTASDEVTEISYWIKEWNVAGDSEIWVKVPSIPALSAATVYLYYGNETATISFSSFDNTMQKLEADDSTAGLWHFDESAGTTLGDSSVNENDGELNNFAVDDSDWVADSTSAYGGSGGALNFSGFDEEYENTYPATITSPYIEVSNDVSLNLDNGDFTMEGWINTTATSFDLPIISYYDECISDPSGGCGFALWLNGYTTYGSPVFHYAAWDCLSTGIVNGVNEMQINDGDWHYFAALRGEEKIMLYIDGEFAMESYIPESYNITIGSPLVFGTMLFEGSEDFFNGQLDEMRISKRALSAEEIKADYERRQYAAIEPTNSLGTEETDPYDGLEEIIAVEGGTVTNTADTVVIDIPADALEEDTEITIEASEAIGDFQVQGIVPVDYIYTFGPEGTTFTELVTIVFDYDDTGMTLEEEQALDVYWYDEITELWEAQGATVDTDLNTLTLEVDHFSSYVIGRNATALEKIDELVLLINYYSESGQIESSGYFLVVHIRRAQELMAEGDDEKAIIVLEQFIEKVKQFTPDKIDEEASGAIIEETEEIIVLLR